MVVCKLMGGLGNQMFQYAYAAALAKEFKEELCLDISYYEGKIPSIFMLHIIARKTTAQVELIDYKSAKRAERMYHVLQYAIRKLNHEKIGCGLFHRLSKMGYYFNFDPFYYPSIQSSKNNKYVYGYFQGVQYFETIKEWLNKQFVANLGATAKNYKNEIENCNAVAIHIRLGDYQEKKNQYLNVCTDTYYVNGIEYIERVVKKPRFFIFTNDAEVVKRKKFIPRDARVIVGTKDYEDLMLMKACKHFVISGSTFSWWGSYLSENIEKVTIAPKKWMKTLRDEPAIMKRTDIVTMRIERA